MLGGNVNVTRYLQPATVLLALVAVVYALVLVALQFQDIVDSGAELFGPGSWQQSAMVSAIVIAASCPALVAWLAYRGRRTWWCVAILGVSSLAVPVIPTVLALLVTVYWLVAREVERAA